MLSNHLIHCRPLDCFVSACGDGCIIEYEEEEQNIEDIPAEELVIEVKTSVWGCEGALNITLCSFLELCIDN